MSNEIVNAIGIKNIIQWLISPQFTGWLLTVKIVASIIVFAMMAFIVFALFKTLWLKRLLLWDLSEFLTYKPYYGVKKLAKQWAKIVARLESGLESEYKLAVIEADSMLTDVLQASGYAGEGLADRLKQLTPIILSNVDEILESHKIRDSVVHDPNYKLSEEEAKKAVSVFEKALTDLGAI